MNYPTTASTQLISVILLLFPQSLAKAANKGVHSDKEYKKKAINDLSDPKKAKTYAGSLQRAGVTKAIVDYCFNGSRFKLFVPSENCYVMFALGNVRCPQPSPNPGAISRGQGKYYCMQLLVHNRSMYRTLTSNMFILVNFICKKYS